MFLSSLIGLSTVLFMALRCIAMLNFSLMKNLKNGHQTFLLCVLTLVLGLSLPLAFAPYDIFPLAIIAPAGLFALSLQASPKKAFWLGFLFGLGLFGAGVYWVYISIHVIGEVPTSFAVLITTLFVTILAAYPATVMYTANRYFSTPKTATLICAYPALWVLSEWVRSWLFSGFPWLFLGYSQTHSPLKGFAPLLGVYGISLAVLLTSALLVHAAAQLKRRLYSSAYLSLFLILLIWISGGLLNVVHWTKPQGNTFSIALVQGDIPQTLKWSPEHLQLSFERYRDLTEPLWGNNKLIIWPEAAIPVPLQNIPHFIDRLNAKARETHSSLILGIPTETRDGKHYHNAIITLGDQNQLYLKRLLVPFGEYTPFSALFARAFNFMDVPMSDMKPGKFTQQPLVIEHTKILTSICYEIAFPDLIRLNDPTVGMLLTVTNDAWFGASNAQAQHLQMAAMRALEFQRPVVFVSNDGITAIISPDGQIQASIPAHTAAVLTSTVRPKIGLTPWMRTGSDTVLLLTIALLLVAVYCRKRNTVLHSAEHHTVTIKN
jgi:apolipoprotein N-acyltransferase